MSRDLEETLDELGPEYRAVVARLRGNGAARASVFSRPAYLVAASLILLAGLAVVFANSSGQALRRSGNAPAAPREYLLAALGNEASVRELIATQNPDGSWQNDFLTRRNAAALRLCGVPAAQVAYKRAMRNLRVRGVL